MMIRRKFSLLIGGNILAFLLAVCVYFIFQIPVGRMEAESAILKTLGYSIRDLRAEINLLDNNSFRKQADLVFTAKAALDEVFVQLDTMKVLSASNRNIHEALEIIKNLKVLFNTNWEIFQGAIGEIDPLLDNLLFMDSTTVISAHRIKNYSSTESREDGRMDKTLLLWEKLHSYIGVLDTNLGSSAQVGDQQSAAIRQTISGLKRQALFISLAIVLGVLVGIFLVLLLFTKGLSSAIQTIARGIEELSSGNLTVKIGIKRGDELGRLSDNLNNFIDQLQGGMDGIKKSAVSSRKIEGELSGIVNNTTQKTRGIGTAASQIVGVLETLEEGVGDSSKAVDMVSRNVEKLSGEIEDQMSMVEESSSAVIQMIASIGSVADITAKKEQTTEMLVDTARAGGEALAETARIIHEINDSVDEISGTADVIRNVASETNLLAMNAAIEAAHAGESGRGFAVVADEIRKLAETSSLNSKRISGVIREVILKIEEAVTAGGLTQKAFEDIDGEVLGVSSSLKEISSNMGELNVGGRQILEAVTELQSVSGAVKEGSEYMVNASAELSRGIGDVFAIAGMVKNDTLSIENSIRGITSVMETAASHARNLNRITDILNCEVGKYKTEENGNRTEEENDR